MAISSEDFSLSVTNEYRAQALLLEEDSVCDLTLAHQNPKKNSLFHAD